MGPEREPVALGETQTGPGGSRPGGPAGRQAGAMRNSSHGDIPLSGTELSVNDADAEIVDRCIKGNAAAFRELVEKYNSQMINLIYRLTGDYHNAEDIAQDTFVSVFAGLKEFQGRAKFSSWLYEIAINKCRDYLRNMRRVENIPLGGTELSVNDATVNDDMKRIQKAVDSLPYEYREAFTLKHIEDLPYSQMQEILNVSIALLKVRVHRAREMLVKLLK